MFGAILRAAGGFAFGMLVLTALYATAGPLADLIGNAMGTNTALYESYRSSIRWLPAIAVLSVPVTLIARAIVEARLPGA